MPGILYLRRRPRRSMPERHQSSRRRSSRSQGVYRWSGCGGRHQSSNPRAAGVTKVHESRRVDAAEGPLGSGWGAAGGVTKVQTSGSALPLPPLPGVTKVQAIWSRWNRAAAGLCPYATAGKGVAMAQDASTDSALGSEGEPVKGGCRRHRGQSGDHRHQVRGCSLHRQRFHAERGCPFSGGHRQRGVDAGRAEAVEAAAGRTPPVRLRARALFLDLQGGAGHRRHFPRL